MSLVDKQLRFYILCGNAAYNKGDRGNLDSQIKLLYEAFPGCQITVDSMRAEVDKDWYRAEVLPRGWILNWQQIRGLAKADLVIWGGGALIADNSFRLLIPLWMTIIGFVKFVLRKPVLAWSHGVILETKLGRFLGAILFQWVDVITVRDENSLRAVKTLRGLTTPVIKTADPAIHLRPRPAEVGAELLHQVGIGLGDRRPLIAISPTYWQFYHRSTDVIPYMLKWRLVRGRVRTQRLLAYNAALTKLCQRLVREFDARVLLLPRYSSRPWFDIDFLRWVVRNSGHPDSVTLFERDDVSPEVYTAMYHHFSLLISSALHDAIFATALDVPCVKLYYEPKGRDFFDAIGSSDRALDWQVLFEEGGVDRVLNIVRFTLTDWAQIKPKVAVARRALQAAVYENISQARALITASKNIGSSQCEVRSFP